MSSNIPETLGVYRETWLILTKTEISIEEIDLQEIGLLFDCMHCIMMCLEEFV